MKRKYIYKTQVIAIVFTCINMIFGANALFGQNSIELAADQNRYFPINRTTLLSTNMQAKPVAETPVMQFSTTNSLITPGGTGTFVVTLDGKGNDSIKGFSFDIQYDASVIDSNSFALDWTGAGSSQDNIQTTFVQKNGVIHIVVTNTSSTDTMKNHVGSKTKTEEIDNNILIDFRLLPVDNLSGLTSVRVENSSVSFYNNSTIQLPNLDNKININGNAIDAPNQNYSSMENTVNVYPNPVTSSQSYINVDLGADSSYYITICDMSGKLVKVLTGNNSGNVKIEVDNLQGSVYIITIYTKGGAIIKKFIKVN